MTKCCACGEAKYSFTFKGLWSRETHPKDWSENRTFIYIDLVINSRNFNRSNIFFRLILFYRGSIAFLEHCGRYAHKKLLGMELWRLRKSGPKRARRIWYHTNSRTRNQESCNILFDFEENIFGKLNDFSKK